MYAVWIAAALTFIGRFIWRSGDEIMVAMFLGLFGWFLQGFGEFSLYVPGVAWIAFTFLGWLAARVPSKPVDKSPRSR